MLIKPLATLWNASRPTNRAWLCFVFALTAMTCATGQNPTPPNAERQSDEEREIISKMQHELIELLRQGDGDERNRAKIRELEAAIAQRSEQLARVNQVHAQQEGRVAEAEVMRAQLAALQNELAETRAHLAKALDEVKRVEHNRQQQPVQGGEFKVFHLRHLPAARAAEIIESMIDPGSTRVALDDRTNSLVVFSGPDSIKVVESLMQTLDVPKPEDDGGDLDTYVSDSQQGGPARTLLVRVFWLADGVPEGDAGDPLTYLPKSVVSAVQRLGLREPRIVTQTVNSLAASDDESMEFESGAPVVVQGEPLRLQCRGDLKTIEANGVRLKMGISLPEYGVDVNGSLTAPLGHYTVLGTANAINPAGWRSIRAKQLEEAKQRQLAEKRAQEEGGLGRPRNEADSFLNQSPTPAEGSYDNSPFAFVVQVIEGQSFPADDRSGDSAEDEDPVREN